MKAQPVQTDLHDNLHFTLSWLIIFDYETCH